MRVDRASIVSAPSAVASAQAERTPEGYLDVDAYLARDGLLEYSDGRSSWLEYRPRAELEAAADSWAHAIVTDDHPPVMVDANNAREYQRGYVISAPSVVEVDDVAYLAARLRVTDAELVSRIVDGQRELSIGFVADVHPEAGTHGGQRYDAVQRSLVGNHVASVAQGRAGPAVRVLLDSAHGSAELCYHLDVKSDPLDLEAPTVSKHTNKPVAKSDEVGMPTTTAMIVGPDGAEVEVPTWVAALVAEALDQRKAADPGAEPPAEIEAAPADAEGEPAANPDDDDKKDPPMSSDAIKTLVRRRGRLERLAAAAGVGSAVIDSADDDALARAYVASVLPHARARIDAATGPVLDALVDVAASTPRVVVTNPFEVVAKTDAAPEDDPIIAAYAAHLAR